MAKNKPMVRIHNVETDEIIEREMTDEEFAELETRRAEILTKEANELAKATAKADLLEKLGISEEEAKLLLS